MEWLQAKFKFIMDDNNMLLVLCSVILAAAAAWLWLKRSSPRRRLPPGPAGLPIIGNLHQLIGPFPHKNFARLSETYGPLMSLRLGSRLLLIVSSPSMAMHILHTFDKTFSGRPQNVSAPRLIYGLPIAFSQPGLYWKFMRQICTSDLFTIKALEGSRLIRKQEMCTLLLSIFASQGSPVSLHEKLHTTINNIISRMVIGKPLHELGYADPKDGDNIESVLAEMVYLIGRFNVGDYIPSLAWMDLQGYNKRSKQLSRKIQSLFQAVIDDRRRKLGGHDADGTDTSRPPDLLDLLLSASTDPKHKALQIQDSNIGAVLLDMFAAGTLSSSSVVEWAFAELLSKREALSKVQEELKENVGTSRFVDETDIPNLPYLQAVVNETLRLHRVTLVLHTSLEACQISNYHIPANTSVYINLWSIHRDPSVWDNPLEFYPDRFIEKPIGNAIAGHKFEFLPFGYGRRSCPGWKLGLLNVHLILANILQAFDWTSPEGKPNLHEKSSGHNVQLESPLIAIPMPRLPVSLYNTLY